jgi:hypothetical protein
MHRGAGGRLHARLLDVVAGRSGTVYADWLESQTEVFVAGIERAALSKAAVLSFRDLMPLGYLVPSQSAHGQRYDDVVLGRLGSIDVRVTD